MRSYQGRLEGARPPAAEPLSRVIGHLKAEHRLDRNYLKGRDGDRANAVLAAAGYHLGLLLRRLAGRLHALIAAMIFARTRAPA
jgi:IS5 family transposase